MYASVSVEFTWKKVQTRRATITDLIADSPRLSSYSERSADLQLESKRRTKNIAT